ncbi:MAG: hypothetical protein CFE40_07185 [Burkholderiales bacterium PBB1]|nr:MAG: hypothetical protein CFE40_07185 [Burkholderiales bacterium PBB1]
MTTVCVYFVASPLQLLAARQIAQTIESGARQVLIWYQPGVGPQVRADEWDASSYLPWPRRDPLPGWMGRHRRLLANIDLVAALIGPCDTLILHSAVFDTEAINYFLRALPRRCGARAMHARILPDGLISIRRYPLSPLKRLIQAARKFRQWLSPDLNYWMFSGDRIGSDAPFCDRIYVLAGLPHEYDPAKVVVLKPLAARSTPQDAEPASRRALVIGQTLVSAGLMTTPDRDAVALQIEQWLALCNIDQVDYKAHPKDSRLELCRPSYRVLELDEPLELWLSRTPYSVVVGVRSSVLLFARQLCAPETQVVAFGWDRTKFKSAQERSDMLAAFDNAGIVQR